MSGMPPNNPLDNTMPTGSFWDNVQARAPKKHTGAEARATQTFLRNKGYNVKVDGLWGPETESAARNWRSARNPAVWNRSVNAAPRTIGSTTTRAGTPHPTPVPGNRTQPVGPVTPPGYRSPAGAGPQGGLNLSQMFGQNLPDTQVGNALPLGLGNNVGNPLSNSLAGVGANMNPGLAAKYAGMEYDPQIQGLQNQINFVPKQTAQNLHDLQTWYAQVQGSLGKARDAASANGAMQTASMGNASAGILASLGGGDNPGAGMVAGAGADAAALSGQLGNIESSFLKDEGPLLQADAMAQSTREQARQQAIARDLLNQQLTLKGQRGAKQGELGMQISEYNNTLAAQRNQNLLGIGQYNNSLAQQRGNNQLSIRQYNNQLAQQNHQNAMDNVTTQAGLALSGAQINSLNKQTSTIQKPGAFVPWDRLNPQQQNYMVTQATAQIAPAKGLHGWKYVAPGDKSTQGMLTRQQNQKVINNAKLSMRKWFMSQHYNNPRLASRIDQAINAAVKQAAIMSQAGTKY